MPENQIALRRITSSPVAAIALTFLVLLIAGALLAPLITPFSPTRMDIAHRLEAPSLTHLFGTDDFGRDVFTRVLFGARLSLLVGLLIVAFATVAGTFIGLLAGYVRPLESVLMRLTDALMAFPDILLGIALMAALGPSLYDVVLALGVVYTPRIARLVRGETLTLVRRPFVEASEVLGAGDRMIIVRHILPHLVSPLLVQATFSFATAILTEAALSFLGAGVPPTTPSWGNMIAGAQQYMEQAQWLILAPGISILLTVLSLQVLGDALRDALDPKLRQST